MKSVKHVKASRGQYRWLVACSIALPVLSAALWYAPFEPTSRAGDGTLAQTEDMSVQTEPPPLPDMPGVQPTVPDRRHQDNQNHQSEAEATRQEHEIPFTADGIYAVVQAISQDDTGHLVLGNDTLLALDRVFINGDKTLSHQDLQTLSELIRVGLPGEAGERAAEVATDYYRYLEDRNRLTASHKPQEGAALRLSGEQLYQELRQLRTMHLGEDVANQLFRAADAQFVYMSQARQLQEDTNLTQDEKLKKVQRMDDELQEASIGIDNWPERHRRFQEEKQRILDAALSREEKRAQVSTLLEREFRPYELEKIEHLELDAL